MYEFLRRLLQRRLQRRRPQAGHQKPMINFSKRALVIINPAAGKRLANRHLTGVIDKLAAGGFLPTVLTTTPERNGTTLVQHYGKDADMIVCIGGDGTFHEVAEGILSTRMTTPICYLSSGTTNDFAKSIGLPDSIQRAARLATHGIPRALDIGTFNDNFFTYVASCGAFTRASYSTPRSLKNTLGHTAYLLEAVRTLPDTHPIHLRIETENTVWEDEFIFAAICNTTSLGGVVHLREEDVDPSDGKLELFLVRNPHNVAELAKTAYDVKSMHFDSPLIHISSIKRVKITSLDTVDWSLDGEHTVTHGSVEIGVRHHALRLMTPKKVKTVKKAKEN